MIDKDTLEKLIADKPPEIRGKAVLLFNGMAQGAKAYQTESTSAHLRDWRSAESALDEFLATIGVGATSERTFSGMPSVVEYLHDQGWKISLRTGYNHRDKGHIRPRKDGKYYLSDVENYSKSGLLQRLDGNKNDASDIDLDRKKRADADTAEYVARINKIKAEAIEGRYIERYEYERALAQRAALFKSDIEAFIRGKGDEVVAVASGDPEKIPDVIEFLLDQFESALSRYAEDRGFTVPPPERIDASKIDTDEEEKGG